MWVMRITVTPTLCRSRAVPRVRGREGIPSYADLHNLLKASRDGAKAIDILRREIPGYDQRVKSAKAKQLGWVDLPGKVGAPVGNQNAIDNETVTIDKINCSDSTIDFKKSNNKGTNDNSTYRAKRLKRDHPGVFKQVEAGELSINAAAKKTGIIKPYIRVRADDIDKAISKLIETYDLEDLQRAVMAYGTLEDYLFFCQPEKVLGTQPICTLGGTCPPTRECGRWEIISQQIFRLTSHKKPDISLPVTANSVTPGLQPV